MPIIPEILLKMRSVWEQKSKDFDAIMLWAVCFFGFLLAGEVTVPSERAYDGGEHLNISDISVDSVTSPTAMKVKTKASKTHFGRDRQNRKQALPSGSYAGIFSQERSERRDAFPF